MKTVEYKINNNEYKFDISDEDYYFWANLPIGDIASIISRDINTNFHSQNYQCHGLEVSQYLHRTAGKGMANDLAIEFKYQVEAIKRHKESIVIFKMKRKEHSRTLKALKSFKRSETKLVNRIRNGK